jgi:hypothetical protein
MNLKKKKNISKRRLKLSGELKLISWIQIIFWQVPWKNWKLIQATLIWPWLKLSTLVSLTLTQSTLNHFNDYFFDGVENGHGGYFRNDDGDWYDYQEWSFIDLRVSIALGLAGMETRRDALLNWVLEQSAANNYLMGELYCRGDINCEQRGDYKGSIPMVGFGPGAYILALKARNGQGPTELCTEAAEYDPGLEDPDTTDGGIETDIEQDSGQSITPGGSGCSCSHFSGSENTNYLVFIFIFCAVFFIRRRQLILYL